MADGGLRVVYPISGDAIGDELGRRAEGGRASLRYFLGDADQRRRAFRGSVNGDRVLGIVSGNRVVGYASFSVGGRGPLAPALARFTVEYGVLRGLFNLLVFKITEPWVGRSSLYVYNVQVDERHRGTGVGSAIMDAIEGIARAQGCRSITLQVTAHNKAIILYVKKGFEVTGTIKLGPIRSFFPFKCLVNMERMLPVAKPVRAAQPSQRPLGTAASPETSAT